MATPNAFRFNQQPNPASAGYGNPMLNDLVTRGQAAEQELYGGDIPEIAGPPGDMEIIDGVTSDIHEAWGQLQDYAHQMWANYRINVTRPDRSNPEAVKANQMFQKNMAKLQYAGAVLKQSNSQLGQAKKAEIDGQGYLPNQPEGVPYIFTDPNDRFVNTEENPAARQSNYAYAKTYETQGATDDAAANVAANQAAGGQPFREQGRTRQAEAIESQFQGPTHERDWRRDLPSGGNGDTPFDPTNVINQARNIRIGALRGDKASLGQLIGKDGIVDARTVNTGDKQGIMLTYKKGNAQQYTRFISSKTEDSPYGGLDMIVDIMQSDVPTKDRVNSTQLYPYFEAGAAADVRDIADVDEKGFQQRQTIFSNLHTKKTNKYKDDDGNEVVLADTEKKGLIQEFESLTKAGQLFTGNGYRVLDFQWDDGVIELTYDDGGYEEKIILDPTTAAGKREFKKMLEYNSDAFATPTNDQYIRGPVSNSQTNAPSTKFEEYLESVKKRYPRAND